jgi:hypothetical protein
MWQKKAAELHGTTEESKPGYEDPCVERDEAAPIISADDSPPEPKPVEYNFTTGRDSYVSYGDQDRFICLVCMEKFPGKQVIIDHEILIHNMYRDEEVKKIAAEKLAKSGKEPQLIVLRQPSIKGAPLPTYTSYADKEALKCVLCMRNFKQTMVLRLHERESMLHKRMLQDPAAVEKAIKELASRGLKPTTMMPETEQQREARLSAAGGPQYRDRAQERREAYNQPAKPAKATAKRRPDGEKVDGSGATASGESPTQKKPKLGAALLGKMGWSAGEGLGAQGTGRTEAITTDLYTPGVGLGAEGGKIGDAVVEAERKTRNNFSDFVEKTKDKARERYEKMS